MVADKDDGGLFGWKNWTIPASPLNTANITPIPGVRETLKELFAKFQVAHLNKARFRFVRARHA